MALFEGRGRKTLTRLLGEQIRVVWLSPRRDKGRRAYLAFSDMRVVFARDDAIEAMFPLAACVGLRALGGYVRLGFQDGDRVSTGTFYLGGGAGTFGAFYGKLVVAVQECAGHKLDVQAFTHNPAVPELPRA